MRQIIALALLLIIGSNSYSQSDAQTLVIRKADSAVLDKVKLDFAVPDIPAFKALGIDPSNILRPSAAKDFGLVFNNFAGRGFNAIPKDVAVEVAPALFMHPWYSLQEYRTRGGLRTLTKTRISLGTNEDDVTGINTIAFGLRTTLIDKGDFRADSAFQQQYIFSRMDAIQMVMGTLRNTVIAALGGPIVYEALPAERKQFILDSLFAEAQTQTGINNLNQIIEDAIGEYKQSKWNATRLDVAYSLLLQSPDSLLGNVKLNKHLLWATLALKPGANNKWGQLLIGVHNNTFSFDSKWYNSFTGNLRFYAGTNRFKGLFELQYQNIDDPVNTRIQTLFTQLGIEANIFKGAWIHFSTGILNALEGDNRSALKSNLNFFLTFPENFNPFK